MQPNVNITTTTNQYLAPMFVDQVLRDNFFFAEVLKKVKSYDGSQMLFPIKYQKGIPSVAFNGFDLLPITQQPVSVNMTFYPSFVATNVALAGSDLSQNNTKSKVLDLMTVMMESRAQDAADDIGNMFQGDGTGFAGKVPAGLGNIVDDGSVAATYGGLSRATYNGLNSTVTSTATISLLKVRQLANSVSDGSVRPDFALTDYNTWAYFEQLLMPFQRNMYQGGKNVTETGSGYDTLNWNNLVVAKDKKVTDGTFYLINSDFLSWYGLKWWEGSTVSVAGKDIVGNVYDKAPYSSTGKAFSWTGWIRAYNQGAINGFMILGGQLICTAPFRQGKLTDITGY